ncbi:hypothetical protein BT63DRAFT_428110 [Microthyrium microscopicum]|uniref:Uncharacterized protein n=1 Tax=Microthyrium microscopicum TaxID=703497 RepID=A0A6A6U425_9PEZI|nr:hypothetical protein BT63DRAFT_428110 [Microthyrium microscopicum]
MPAVETAAAALGIVGSSIAGVKWLMKRHQKKKAAKQVQPNNALSIGLRGGRGSEEDNSSELSDLDHVESDIFPSGPSLVLREMKSLIRPSHPFEGALMGYQSVLNQSRQFAMASSLRLPISTDPYLNATSISSTIHPPPSRTSNPRYHANTCKNARAYREGRVHLWRVARPISNSNGEEYACSHCSMVVNTISLRVSRNDANQSRIWMDPVGLFKAHCARERGRADGWTCIWPYKDAECNSCFARDVDLLKHMLKHHVKLGPGQRILSMDEPSDKGGAAGYGADNY